MNDRIIINFIWGVIVIILFILVSAFGLDYQRGNLLHEKQQMEMQLQFIKGADRQTWDKLRGK